MRVHANRYGRAFAADLSESVDLGEAIQFVGLDVRAAQTAVAAVELGSGRVRQQRIVAPPVAAVEWLAGLPGRVRAVYEAGPTRFGLARVARERGIEVMVCSPGAIPG